MKALTEEEIFLYARHILTEEVLTEVEAERAEELHNEVTTLSNVVLMVKYMNRAQDRLNASFIDTLQIQQRVLEELGATSEMFVKAQEDYTKIIDTTQKELKAKLEASEAGKVDTNA